MSYYCPVDVAWVVQRKILSSLWERWLGMTIFRKCDKLSLEHCICGSLYIAFWYFIHTCNQLYTLKKPVFSVHQYRLLSLLTMHMAGAPLLSNDHARLASESPHSVDSLTSFTFKCDYSGFGAASRAA